MTVTSDDLYVKVKPETGLLAASVAFTIIDGVFAAVSLFAVGSPSVAPPEAATVRTPVAAILVTDPKKVTFLVAST